MNIDALIAALGGRYDTDEAEVIQRVLREYGGTIPDAQLIEEAALALAIHRRWSDLVRSLPEELDTFSSVCPPLQSPQYPGISPRRRWRWANLAAGSSSPVTRSQLDFNPRQIRGCQPARCFEVRTGSNRPPLTAARQSTAWPHAPSASSPTSTGIFPAAGVCAAAASLAA